MQDLTSVFNDTSTDLLTNFDKFVMNMGQVAIKIKKSTEMSRTAKDFAEETTVAISKSIETSKKIDEIIKIINTIANQINLLSLNAAIEAAHAGEFGKSFAVVADEVKKLADKTRESTVAIEKQILESKESSEVVIQVVENVVALMDDIFKFSEEIEISLEEQSAATTEISSTLSNQTHRLKNDIEGFIENMLTIK